MKDPAFLFYTGDFLSGTMFFTDEQVGIYLRLLMAQHQHGRLSEKQVKIICKTHDKEVLEKFEIDIDGNYYNSRLELEVNKRKAYSESRSKNRTSKVKEPKEHMINISKTYVKHMENENRDINKGKDFNKNMYRSFLHLSISHDEFEKLKTEYTKTQIDLILDSIENYKENKKYLSLYLTAKKWLLKEYPKTEKQKVRML